MKKLFPQRARRFAYPRELALLTGIVMMSGCQSPTVTPSASSEPSSIVTDPLVPGAELQTLHEGDVIKVSVPGAPNLDTVQTIRPDGRVTLVLLGDVQAVGKTPIELQSELSRQLGPELVSKEVTVSVVASNLYAFVTGAVLRPGKVTSARRITVLDSIMEAGGFDLSKANTKAVVVIRKQPDGTTRRFTVDAKSILEGKESQPFMLQHADIVFVPERFAFF